MPSMLLTSGLLPVPHGFSTRHGGVSSAPYDALNVGLAVGDDRAKVEENLSRIARSADVRPEELHTVSQVHGSTVLEARSPGAGVAPILGEADAVWTARPDAAVAVKTADCVPILIVDPEGRRVAAVHSGWKGTDSRVVARTVEALEAQGSKAGRLLAAIGPSIRVCCYVVAEDLARRFQAQFGEEVAIHEDGKVHLDLVRAVCRTLEQSGVPSQNIDVLPECTACDRQAYFSHRRDQGVTGRHLSFAVCRF
jgi:polyphenol oxidase